jgi:ribosomal protein RSM22 (predicted rRNA methylase)
MTESEVINYFTSRANSSFDNGAHARRVYSDMRGNYARLKSASGSIALNVDGSKLYGLARLPGTLTALRKTLTTLSSILPDFKPQTVLDCGSGPGTALFAIENHFFCGSNYTAIEPNSEFVRIAREATNTLDVDFAKRILWQEQRWEHSDIKGIFDLVCISYVLSETQKSEVNKILKWALLHARVLLLVDTGTPQSFSQILLARNEILSNERFTMIAPCPHNYTCPLMGKDFCHFTARFTRPKALMDLKNASTKCEDEKFCYLIAARKDAITSSSINRSRIIARPMKRKGHRIFDLCSARGHKERLIVSKSDADYKQTADLKWGDCLQRQC